MTYAQAEGHAGGLEARAWCEDATSVSGELNVRASADGGYACEVSSFSGEIRNCFDAHRERASQYGPGSTLQGTVARARATCA